LELTNIKKNRGWKRKINKVNFVDHKHREKGSKKQKMGSQKSCQAKNNPRHNGKTMPEIKKRK